MVSPLHYLRIYRQFFASNLAEATSYRAHFVLLIIMDLLFYVSTIAGVSFIFDHVEAVGDWGRYDFLFFVSFMIAVDQLHMTLFSESFWEFSSDLRLGKLDFWLLRPAGTIFTVFFRFIRPGSFCLLPVPWFFLGWFGSRLHFGLLEWIALPVLVLFALSLLVTIEIALSMVMFWTIESIGINFLRMQFQTVARWPHFVYQYFFQKVFTFLIPVLLIGSAPVSLLYGEGYWLICIAVCVEIFLWWGIAKTWALGLRRYESASS